MLIEIVSSEFDLLAQHWSKEHLSYARTCYEWMQSLCLVFGFYIRQFLRPSSSPLMRLVLVLLLRHVASYFFTKRVSFEVFGIDRCQLSDYGRTHTIFSLLAYMPEQNSANNVFKFAKFPRHLESNARHHLLTHFLAIGFSSFSRTRNHLLTRGRIRIR